MINIILIGPQGCGKGTQAQGILSKYGQTYIEAGAMIRQQTLLQDKKSTILNHLVNQEGVLIPDGIIMDIVCDKIEKTPSPQGYLFDGFPRSIDQYISLKEYLAEKQIKLDAGIYIYISDEEAVKRLGGRRVCTVCKKSYSLFLEPERTICECGGELKKRVDDEPEAIQQRLNEFHSHTTPILKLMQEDKILIEINGEQSIEQISLDIQRHLDIFNK